MKILYSNQFSSKSVVGNSKLNALKSLGYEVHIFDDIKCRIPILNKFPERLRYKLKKIIPLLNKADLYEMNREIISLAEKISPEILIVDKGIDISLDTIKAIRSKKIITANLFPDNLNHWPWIKKAAAVYDYFFHFDSGVVELLHNIGFKNCYQIPFGCCSKLHRMLPESNKDNLTEICFVGAHYHDREKILGKLTGYDLKIFGYKQWKKTMLNDYYYGEMTNDDAMVSLYNNSKIVINSHYEYTGSGANVRTFEILGCGAFQLVDNQNDIRDMFKDGEDLVIYMNAEDLKQKVDYYLKNENERKKIALNGYKKVHSRYTYEHSLRKMMNIISGDR